jgi:hypothetical protein
VSDYDISTFSEFVDVSGLQFGIPSPRPSTLSFDTTNETVQMPSWEQPIVRPPLHFISFWNVNDRAMSALARTNNALEASHLQFAV